MQSKARRRTYSSKQKGQGEDFKKKTKDPEKTLHIHMDPFLGRISSLAKDNTKGRVIIFAYYLEKIQMNAVLSQGDSQISLILAVKVKQ